MITKPSNISTELESSSIANNINQFARDDSEIIGPHQLQMSLCSLTDNGSSITIPVVGSEHINKVIVKKDTYKTIRDSYYAVGYRKIREEVENSIIPLDLRKPALRLLRFIFEGIRHTKSLTIDTPLHEIAKCSRVDLDIAEEIIRYKSIHEDGFIELLSDGSMKVKRCPLPLCGLVYINSKCLRRGDTIELNVEATCCAVDFTYKCKYTEITDFLTQYGDDPKLLRMFSEPSRKLRRTIHNNYFYSHICRISDEGVGWFMSSIGNRYSDKVDIALTKHNHLKAIALLVYEDRVKIVATLFNLLKSTGILHVDINEGYIYINKLAALVGVSRDELIKTLNTLQEEEYLEYTISNKGVLHVKLGTIKNKKRLLEVASIV